jgi:hypothetical protein
MRLRIGLALRLVNGSTAAAEVWSVELDALEQAGEQVRTLNSHLR